jgi:hypothetical protein
MAQGPGFDAQRTLGGGEPQIGTFTVANDAIFSPGEMLTLASNEADAGTTNDTTFIGVALGTVDNSADGKTVRAYLSPDTIYSFFDGTAHAAGATLDLGSGGRELAPDSNSDFTVISNNAATEPTLVIITPGEHYLHGGG